MKISEENTKIVNDALEKGQKVRRDGRNYVVVSDDNKYIEKRINNNIRVKRCRLESKK